MNSSQSGFTLIELAVVVLIIGILAEVALVAYQDYTIRAKISEAVVAMSPCRVAVTDMYLNGGTPPAANSWGCEGISSKFVASLTTDANGAVTATIANGIHINVDGKRVTLIPAISGTPVVAPDDMGKGINVWICGGAGTTLNARYLPGSCRGI
jgi:type IV pilus assembly protein PilA